MLVHNGVMEPMVDGLTIILVLTLAIVPMICVVIWQVRKALQGGYYYSNEEDSPVTTQLASDGENHET